MSTCIHLLKTWLNSPFANMFSTKVNPFYLSYAFWHMGFWWKCGKRKNCAWWQISTFAKMCWTLFFFFLNIDRDFSIFSSSAFRRKKVRVLWYPWRCHNTLTLAHNSKTFQHFQMELGTHVSSNNTHVYTKPHNCSFNNYSVMPLIRLRKMQTRVDVRLSVF